MHIRTASQKPQPPDPGNATEALEARAREQLPAYYRGQANRFVGLAMESPFGEAKNQFLLLAQYYDVLAAHIQRRSAR